MVYKKFASLLVAGAMITAMGVTSAFAATPVVELPVCSYSSCTLTGSHYHDGTHYAAHTSGDGHTYHSSCGVSGCTTTGSHSHRSGHGGHRSGGHH